MEEIFRSVSYNNVVIPRCENTQLQVKVLHSKCFFSKSTKVLASKCRLLKVPEVKVLIMHEGHFKISYILFLDYKLSVFITFVMLHLVKVEVL